MTADTYFESWMGGWRAGFMNGVEMTTFVAVVLGVGWYILTRS